VGQVPEDAQEAAWAVAEVVLPGMESFLLGVMDVKN